MKKINYWLRTALGMSTTETNGIMFLIPLIIVLISSPYIYQYYNLGKTISLNHTKMDSLMAEMEEDMKQVQDSLSKNRYNQDKNLSYKKYDRNKFKYDNKDQKRSKKPQSYKKSYKKPVIEPFDLNSADTLTLKSLYGIGPVLANRIVKYRDLLGGYTSKEQLNEVYGLQDSIIMALDSLSYIHSSFQPKRVNINSSDEVELKKHPYLSWKEAQAISSYKFQHGELTSPNDLNQIHLLDSNKINKLLPYLAF